MTDENSGRFNLSRRKALAGIGSIGAAIGLGGIGTYAQFTDTESRSVTFTAGGIDGVIDWNGSYNGRDIDSDNDLDAEIENVQVRGGDNEITAPEVTADVHFTDVKPGDFGCVNFSVEVDNNPAWVASCIDILEDSDWKNYEPEVDADPHVDQANAGPNQSFDPEDGQENSPNGDLADTMLTLPYYDSDNSCQFFDPQSDSVPAIPPGGSVPAGFWSNEQPDGDKPGAAVLDEDGTTYFLVPKTIRDASQTQSLSTATWSTRTNEFAKIEASNGVTVGEGCVFLEGDPEKLDPSNNTQGVSPLVPGATLNFGYDWHLPFTTGNIAMGDRMTLRLGFKFLQTRHTEAPDFASFAPGNNTNSTDAGGR